MTRTTDLIDLVHAAQLAAVTKAQDLTVATVSRIADLGERVPKGPARVARLTGPLSDSLAEYRSDWAKVNRSFLERLSDAARNGGTPQQDVSRPTVVKSAAVKKSSAKG